MKNFTKLRLLTLLCFICLGVGNAWGETWTRCTSVLDLTSGGTFIIGYEATANSGIIVPMKNSGTITTSALGILYSGTTTGSTGSGTIDMSSVTETTDYEVTIAASTIVEGAITIKCGDNYLGNANTKNNCKLFESEATTTAFTPTVGTNDVFTLKIVANANYYTLQYNSSSTRFAVYAGTQKNVVIYKKSDGNQASAPSLTTGGNFTTSSFDVTITNNESGATVYYTTDGSDPTTSSANFTGESKTITISATTTVKAMAVIEGKDNSSVTSATYKYAVYASLADLVAVGAPTSSGDSVLITLTDETITNTYTTKAGIRCGLYLKSGEKEVEIFVNGTAMPEDWQVNGTISGTIKGKWMLYSGTWEICPKSWEGLNYTAPSKENPTLTLSTYKSALTVGGANDSFTVTTSSNGAISVTSSAPEVATASLVGTTVTVTPLAAGTTTITVSTTETSSYYTKSVSYNLTVVEPAILPFFFNDSCKYIKTTPGMSQSGLGTKDYATSRTKLKFDTTGDNVIINFADTAKSVAFAIKGNSFSGGQFDVMTSADGNTYEPFLSFTKLPSTDSIVAMRLADNVRYIKFVYTSRSSGNVGLGYITISNWAPAIMEIKPGNKWATFSTPFNVDIPANVYAYGFSVNEEGQGIRTKVGGDTDYTVLGKSALLLYTDNESGYYKIYYDGMSIGEPAESPENNQLHTVYEFIPAGGFRSPATGYANYILQNGASGIGFYKVVDTNTLNPNRAYLEAPEGVAVKGFIDLDETTGISTVNNGVSVSAPVYNLAGQVVGKDYKGIVIVNGKKMLNK